MFDCKVSREWGGDVGSRNEVTEEKEGMVEGGRGAGNREWSRAA